MTTHTSDESDAASNPGSTDEDESPAILAGSRIASALRTAGSRASSWVRHSALYQWLTAEPDPEVIVIDLRETWTVGPVLQILDWIIDRLVDAADDSRVVSFVQRGAVATRAAPLRVLGLLIALFGIVVAGSGLLGGVATARLAAGGGLAVLGLIAMQDDRDWATLRETRPVALTIAALEPPEPPASGAGEDTANPSQSHTNEVTSRTDDSTEAESSLGSSADDIDQTDSNNN